MIANGDIPEGFDVCHHCDNPSCVNAAHLFLGTAKDNVADCWNKGRHMRHKGSKNPRATVTEDDVRAIRASADSTKELAKRFGTTYKAVYKIRTHETWKHI